MFSYHPEILERYPTIRAGVVYAEGLVNAVSPEGLLNEYRAQQLVTAAEMAGVLRRRWIPSRRGGGCSPASG